jgi:hypothetical protein
MGMVIGPGFLCLLHQMMSAHSSGGKFCQFIDIFIFRVLINPLIYVVQMYLDFLNLVRITDGDE